MNSRKRNIQRTRSLFGRAALSVLLFCAGCSTTAYKKSDATALDLRQTAAAVRAENQRLDDVNTTLISLVNNPATDLKQQFKLYSASLDRLYGSIERTDDAARKMRQQSEDYFEAWKKQLATMNYDIIREQSGSRLAAVSNQFEVVNSRYVDTREVVLPLLAYLEDIRKALSADLTTDGLAAVKSIMEHANDNAHKVQEGLSRLADGLAEAGARMSSMVNSDVKPQMENRGDAVVTRAAASGLNQ